MNLRRASVAAALVTAGLASPAAAHAADYDDAVRADNPLTYLRMEEQSGSVAYDASAHGRHGQYSGDLTRGIAAPFVDAGVAVRFGATGSIAAQVQETSRSVQFWVNPDRLRRDQQAGFVAHGDPASNGWALGLGERRKLTFVTENRPVNTRVTVPAGSWTMLSVTWRPGSVKVLVNGASSIKESTLRTAAAPSSADGQIVVGGTARGAFTGAFSGRMDEFALFSQELTASAAAEHFAAAKLPVNTAPPAITGTTSIGETLTADPGLWAGSDVAPTFQWQRCDADGNDCDDIPGATSSTHVVTEADACATLQVIVTVTNSFGSSTAVSGASAPIAGTCPSGGTSTGSGETTGEGSTTEQVDGGTAAVDGSNADSGGTTTTTTTGESTVTQPTPVVAGVTATQPSCLKLVRGFGTVKVRGLGQFRLRAGKDRCITRTSPLRISFKAANGKRLERVAYRLGTKKLRGSKRPSFAVAVKPAALRAGAHRLTVRITPRAGKAKTVKLRLKTVRV